MKFSLSDKPELRCPSPHKSEQIGIDRRHEHLSNGPGKINEVIPPTLRCNDCPQKEYQSGQFEGLDGDGVGGVAGGKHGEEGAGGGANDGDVGGTGVNDEDEMAGGGESKS